MIVITRRDFLPELGKLLAFMHEEDRQIAISMYEKMFNDVENEQELIHFLVSPTRQAVIIARVYDSKARKLDVRSQDGGTAQVSGSELPAFISTINDIHEEAIEEQGYAPVILKDQISFFNETGEDYQKPVQPIEVPEEPAVIRETAETIPEEVGNFIWEPAEEAAVQPNQSAQIEQPDYEVQSVQPVQPVQPFQLEQVMEVEETASRCIPDNQKQEEPEAAEQTEDRAVDDFIKDFDLLDDISAAEKETQKTQEKTKHEELDSVLPAVFSQEAPVKAELTADTEAATVRKPKVFMMILYILLAVPITALGVLILLIPALLFLLLAVIACVAGFSALGTAFGGFTVFADILVVIGISLVIIALGILFLWTFVWFLGGAIVNLINGAIQLGGKLCYKEEQLK